MARRKLLAHYGREVRNRTKLLNTLHTLFIHQGHTTVVKEQYLQLYEQRITELKEQIQPEAKEDEGMRRGEPIVAYTYGAHIGDGSRISRVTQVSNYLGFVPYLDYSGMIWRQEHITKR